MFEVIFIIAVSVYFIQSVIFLIGTNKKYDKLKESELPTVTVIVAARNEEKNIIRCMESLDQLVYPEDKLDIIIVDDKSTDRTGEIVGEYIKDRPKFKKLTTTESLGHLKGKTNALANAIKKAKGEIILTTDADCAVSPTWAKTIASYYKEDVGLVNGFTCQEAYNSFTGMQNLDFIYLLNVAAGTINFNLPLSCIGNNMSYRKAAYEAVGGYEKLPFSVTEDFNLLFAIYKLHKYKVIYPLDEGALVISRPFNTVKELFHQKKRWGVGGLKSPLRGFLVMTSGFIAHLGFIISPFFFTPVVLLFMILKLITDFLSLYLVLSRLKLTSTLKYFLAFEIYFIVYVVALPFIVLPNRKVKWKDRTF